MVNIDLRRIKNLRYLGTYVLEKESMGGRLPDMDIIGKTVSMYIDFELAPTTHFIIDDGSCKMYMKHASTNNTYSAWEEFKVTK